MIITLYMVLLPNVKNLESQRLVIQFPEQKYSDNFLALLVYMFPFSSIMTKGYWEQTYSN